MKPTPEAPPKDLNRTIVLRPMAGAVETACDGEARLLEAVGLAQALGLDVAAAEAAPLRQINARTFLGSGRVDGRRERSTIPPVTSPKQM